MDSAGYVTLTRQSGLLREMQEVANNIANLSTTGFRREGVIFTEHVAGVPGGASLSMGSARARLVDLTQGDLSETGGTYDFAIRGEGFFLVETATGQELTRAGNFTSGADGALVTADGARLLDEGGSPVQIPPGAGSVLLAADGTLSADGQPVARIGLWQPTDALQLSHRAGSRFSAGEVQPATGATLLQGYLEDSNVNPVNEVARMIEVQRAYELGQGLLDREDQRMRGVIDTLGRG